MHPLEGVVVPETPGGDLDDVPEFARREIVDPAGVYERLRREGLLNRAVQAYQAAITFVDDRVGVLLDDLASSRYADDTVVIVWSDNAYHLGEKLHLEKMTLWERATHVPFLVHHPTRLGARRVPEPVSMIDLRATVADICGARVHGDDLDTRSLLGLVNRADGAEPSPAISTWRAGNHAVRWEQWRLIRYRGGHLELYDHSVDPDEMRNVASHPENADVIARLASFLPENG
jgi:arylsulfatase A-like enzyme